MPDKMKLYVTFTLSEKNTQTDNYVLYHLWKLSNINPMVW